MASYTSLAEIRNDLYQGRITCRALVTQYLARIEAHQTLNAFLEVFAEEALAAADRIDEKIKSNTAGRLAGLVLGLKDNICYRGHKVSAGSQILKGFESIFDATVVERLLAEDCIILGRLNCDEFAMGSSNENSSYGPVRNPLNPALVPGGSSGGSAAAVAAELVHAALGSDTGGSIRQPASFCGVVGFKPTYGRISRWGLLAYASSFDQIGPFTRSVADAALLTEIMAGHDPRDNTSSTEPVPPMSSDLELPSTGPYTIGYIRETLDSPGIDPLVKKGIEEVLQRLQAAGHKVKPLSFPFLNQTIPAYYVLTTAEASSNLARYDGVRFGYRSPNARTMEEVYVKSRSEGFGPEVKRRIMLGTFVLSTGYYDAYFTQAQKVRRLIQEATQRMLAECDFVLSPTAPSTAFPLGDKSGDPIQMYLSDIYTVHANLAGNPAISVPACVHENGLPFGVHLLADYFQESELFRFSQELLLICEAKPQNTLG